MDELRLYGETSMNSETFYLCQTYCERIYVVAPHNPGDSGQLVLLAHELIHSRQL